MKKLMLFFATFLVAQLSAQKLSDGIYGKIDTNKGEILVKLFYEQTPLTVANFITLAEGKNPFVDKKYKNKKYYDGLTFHRVISDFMIQGGDPTGTGAGSPGYKFQDEIVPELKHDAAGILSMANAGPNTNGSQFFITHKETPWLDGKHTVFGKVIQGQDVVNAIEKNDKIKTVTILRIGKDATKFDEKKALKPIQELADKQNEIEKVNKKNLKYFKKMKAKATTLPSGVQIFVYQKDKNNQKPEMGDTVNIDYTGYLSNGKMFDTSIEEIAIKNKAHNKQKAQAQGYVPLQMQMEENMNLIPGFAEAVKQLNYNDKAIIFIPSEQGYGARDLGIIPPNSDIVFDIHLTK